MTAAVVCFLAVFVVMVWLFAESSSVASSPVLVPGRTYPGF